MFLVFAWQDTSTRAGVTKTYSVCELASLLLRNTYCICNYFGHGDDAAAGYRAPTPTL